MDTNYMDSEIDLISAARNTNLLMQRDFLRKGAGCLLRQSRPENLRPMQKGLRRQLEVLKKNAGLPVLG